MGLLTHNEFSPWKDASNGIGEEDAQAAFYIKCIADTGAAGTQLDQATIQVANGVDTITIRYAEGGGGIAADADINSYTLSSGAAGTITTIDANANSIGEIINVINGVGAGQTATRRYRAAVADVPPALATVAGDLLAVAQTNILLGRTSAGYRVLIDGSNAGLSAASDMWVGIGTKGGCIEGSGALMPDYFEDIPGSSTVAGVNLPVRSGSTVPRKADEAVTRRLQYRVTGFSIGATMATVPYFCVHDIRNTVLFATPLVNATATQFVDLSRTPIYGPVGEPIFCRFSGTVAFVDGPFHIRAESRVC